MNFLDSQEPFSKPKQLILSLLFLTTLKSPPTIHVQLNWLLKPYSSSQRFFCSGKLLGTYTLINIAPIPSHNHFPSITMNLFSQYSMLALKKPLSHTVINPPDLPIAATNLNSKLSSPQNFLTKSIDTISNLVS
ncbi:hypothetical protein ES332_D12G172200v1 [Gossypium tomentosum]|uniref:Uncharacterized protein n=1 Tax=Gossypium tomentosum TaxID=34277 RepID=A0A5D2I9N8_GOSTO|nr:hypothetical protein ES332_D12G172200v1 [Gossypium tomentosum]